jgi:hypothetical protein
MATNSAYYEENIHKFVALNPCALANPPVASVEVTEEKDADGNTVINPLNDLP